MKIELRNTTLIGLIGKVIANFTDLSFRCRFDETVSLPNLFMNEFITVDMSLDLLPET